MYILTLHYGLFDVPIFVEVPKSGFQLRVMLEGTLLDLKRHGILGKFEPESFGS